MVLVQKKIYNILFRNRVKQKTQKEKKREERHVRHIMYIKHKTKDVDCSYHYNCILLLKC